MLSHKKVIKTDVTTLLWMLLKTYQCTVAQVIRSTIRKLKKLYETPKSYKYNFDKLYDYGLKTILILADAGENDSQAFKKIKALKAAPNSKFNNTNTQSFSNTQDFEHD